MASSMPGQLTPQSLPSPVSKVTALSGLGGHWICSLVAEHCGCWTEPKFDRCGRQPLEQPNVCHPKVSGLVHEICTDGLHGPCWMTYFCGGGVPVKPPTTTPALFFCAMMELCNEIQLGRLVIYVLGSLSVERKTSSCGAYLYSLSAGSENSYPGSGSPQTFGRGPMTPTVEAVGLRFRCWHVFYGQFPHSVRFGVVLEDFPVGDPARYNRSCQRDDFSLADRNNRQKRTICCAKSGQQESQNFLDLIFEDF